MKIDVLLQQVTIRENGTSSQSCPGLMVVNWLPPGEVQVLNPGGRKLTLQNNLQKNISDDYRTQFEMRATVTGKSWLEVQIISMHDPGFFDLLIDDLANLAKKGWPLPIGASLFDRVSNDIKKGRPQVIASGKSEVFPADSIPKSVTIALTAPADLLEEASNLDPITRMPTDLPVERKVLLPKDSPNGSIRFELSPA